MRRFASRFGLLATLALVGATASVRADASRDPLRLFPADTDFFFKIEQPRKLVDLVYGLDVLKQLQKIDIIREAYESTNYRRFFQLVAYFEKQLGMKYPEIIDKVAGGGIAVGGKIGNPAPILLVVQGKDEEAVAKLVQLALTMLDQELSRQESKERIKKTSYRGFETYHFGKDFHAARAGDAILLSNKIEALHEGLDLHQKGTKSSIAEAAGVMEARSKLLPADPLAWGWLNFKNIHKLPGAEEIYKDRRDNFILTVFYSAYIDLIRRSPYVCAGIYHKDNSLSTTVRFPRGLDGMPPELSIWHPDAGQMGSLPLLKPRNLLFSGSYYWDMGKYWDYRNKLFTEKNAKAFEQFDKTVGRVLFGAKFSKLLTTAGPHHRLVAVQPTESGYKTRPSQLFPAGAIVIDMRDPDEFAKSMESILRASALIPASQLGLKLMEEKHGDCTLVGYRFPEEAGKVQGFLRNDTGNIRYNFSPCFARVGNLFFASSTIELGRELVDLLDKENKAKGLKGSPAVNLMQVYGRGGAVTMKVFKDQLLTQTILNQASSPSEAEKQVDSFIEIVARLGLVEIEEQYEKTGFRFDIRWRWKN